MSSSNVLSRRRPVSLAVTKRTRLLPYLFVAAAAGLFLFPFLRTLAGNPDEGIYLYGAQMTALGAIPARDFVELQGPGTFYWLALFFKFLGVSFSTARLALLLTGVSIAVLLFHLSRRVGGTGILAAVFATAIGIPLGVMNSPHYDSNLFALISFAVFLAALAQVEASGSRWRIQAAFFGAGALAGLTSCFLQQKGAYLLVAFVLSLLLLHRSVFRRFATALFFGFASVVSCEALLYACAHALPSLVYANLLWPLSTYENVNRAPYGWGLRETLWHTWFTVLHLTLPAPIAYGAASLFSLPYVLVLALPLLLPAVALARPALTLHRDLCPYWVAGYALWASELHRWDLGHLRNASLLLLLLFFLVCERIAHPALTRTVLFVAGCLMLTSLVSVASAEAYRVPLHSRHGTVYALAPDPALNFLLAHTEPGEKVFCYPYATIYYFLADVRNPTRWSNLMYGINTAAQFHEAVNDLDRQNVRYVLYDTVFSGQALTKLFPAYHDRPAAQLIMEPYLESHYHRVATAGDFAVLERNN